MSTLDTYEDLVKTAIRLISSNIKVIKNDGSIASIYVSAQWYDRELFKNCDAQISIARAPFLGVLIPPEAAATSMILSDITVVGNSMLLRRFKP